MIDLYYWPTPNGHKITLFLEETGLEYQIKPINIGKGDQFDPEKGEIVQWAELLVHQAESQALYQLSYFGR